MKRKFVKVMFFGALALSTVTYVGGKEDVYKRQELYHCKYGWHNEPHFPKPYATHTAALSYGPEQYM